jgi:formylglycine-generating enzyme
MRVFGASALRPRIAVRVGTSVVVTVLAFACTDASQSPGQLVLHVTTDAPLADESGPGLFQAVRIEVLDADRDFALACDSCRRDVSVDAAMVRNDGVSFGVVPGDESALVRVRLYRVVPGVVEEPREGSTLEAWIRLPDVAPGEIVHQTIELATETLGSSHGTADEPVSAAEGLPEPGRVGSWPGAQPVDCAGDPPNDSSGCVRGGAFWMGHPLGLFASVSGSQADQERLVIISPFWIDLSEATVQEVRASGVFTRPSDDFGVWNHESPPESGTEAEFGSAALCTFTAEPDERDDLPANCMSHALARTACMSRGDGWDLPSEAELEYVSGAMQSGRFPWGETGIECGDAVVAKGWIQFFENTCLGEGESRLPHVAGSGTRDRVPTPQGEIVDLVGNVSEWTLDTWQRQGETCWGSGIFVDPVCDQPSLVDPLGSTLKGGAWFDNRSEMGAFRRGRVPLVGSSYQMGFRCARPAE